MSKRANPTVIGAFVLVAVALVVAGILTLGGLQLFTDETTAVAFFDGDVGGLAVGSPVLFRGAQLGQVSRIEIGIDPYNRIAVYFKIAWKRGPEGAPRIRTQKDLQPFIDRGLRAQLRIVSLVTGQLSVSLDFLPNTPVVLTGIEPGLPEVPTAPTQLEQYQARLERLLAALEKIDLPRVAHDVDEMVRSVRDVAGSPDLTNALRTAGDAFRSADATLKHLDTQVAAVGERAGATLDDTRKLVRKANREIDSLAVSLRSTLEATRGAVASAQGTMETVTRSLDGETRLGDDLSQALRQLTGAARSLNALADYLERHPEALLRGKQEPEAQ
jgi:paraquat-inducible protein B